MLSSTFDRLHLLLCNVAIAAIEVTTGCAEGREGPGTAGWYFGFAHSDSGWQKSLGDSWRNRARVRGRKIKCAIGRGTAADFLAWSHLHANLRHHKIEAATHLRLSHKLPWRVDDDWTMDQHQFCTCLAKFLLGTTMRSEAAAEIWAAPRAWALHVSVAGSKRIRFLIRKRT